MDNSFKYEIYSGAGNDFVILDNRSWQNHIPLIKQEEFTKFICGTMFKEIDGVIYLDKPLKRDSAFRMNYYNRDGSFGAMCGNGARCISMFAFKNGITESKQFSFEAVDDIYYSEIIDDKNVKLYFPEPKQIKLDLQVMTEFEDGIKELKAHYMDVASDHLVLFMEDEKNRTVFDAKTPDDIDIINSGRLLRHHPDFFPRGANINFAQVLSENEIRIRTYERGVERETLACGTGIISSAIVSALKGYAKPPVKVLVKSGERLIVDIKLQDGNLKELSLTGSAKKVSEGIIE